MIKKRQMTSWSNNNITAFVAGSSIFVVALVLLLTFVKMANLIDLGWWQVLLFPFLLVVAGVIFLIIREILHMAGVIR